MFDIPSNKFPLGNITLSPEIDQQLSGGLKGRIEECLRRHAACDWGIADEDTAANNLRLVENPDGLLPIVSKHRIDPGKPSPDDGPDKNILLIVTGGDRSETEVKFHDG
jgi:hypothetical protein